MAALHLAELGRSQLAHKMQFRHCSNQLLEFGGVMPPGLTTSAMIFVESSGRLSKNLGIAIVNPNGSDVSIAMTLRKSDGTQVATTSFTVAAHQQISKFVMELFTKQSTVPSDFTGTLVLTSSPLPVAMIGLRFRDSNFSTLPVTSLSAVS